MVVWAKARPACHRPTRHFQSGYPVQVCEKHTISSSMAVRRSMSRSILPDSKAMNLYNNIGALENRSSGARCLGHVPTNCFSRVPISSDITQ